MHCTKFGALDCCVTIKTVTDQTIYSCLIIMIIIIPLVVLLTREIVTCQLVYCGRPMAIHLDYPRIEHYLVTI